MASCRCNQSITRHVDANEPFGGEHCDLVSGAQAPCDVHVEPVDERQSGERRSLAVPRNLSIVVVPIATGLGVSVEHRTIASQTVAWRSRTTMAEQTSIEWTQSTSNPVTGCTKLSAGCDHCYTERFAERFRGVAGHPYEQGFDLTLRPERGSGLRSHTGALHRRDSADADDRVWSFPPYRSSKARTFISTKPNCSVTVSDATIVLAGYTAPRVTGEVSIVIRAGPPLTMMRVSLSPPPAMRRALTRGLRSVIAVTIRLNASSGCGRDAAGGLTRARARALCAAGRGDCRRGRCRTRRR